MTHRERFRREDVAGLLAQRASETPDRRFLSHEGRRWTYAEVQAQAGAFAAALRGWGVAAGDRVALHLPNRPEFVVAVFGAARLGAVVVPLDPRLTTTELQYLLRHSEAGVVVTTERWTGSSPRQRVDRVASMLPELREVISVGWKPMGPTDGRVLPWDQVLRDASGEPVPDAVRVDPDADPVAVLYTAGSTGKPKGVVLTHSNLLAPATALADVLRLREADVVSGITNLFNVFGMGPGVLGTVAAGASLALQEDAEPARMLELIETERVTVQYGVPTAFLLALRERSLKERDLTSLRAAVIVGAPMTGETLSRIRREFVDEVWVAYGLTEAGAVIAARSPLGNPLTGQFTTVGTPMPGVDLRVFESDGTPLPEESMGELAVRGPGVMREYYRQPSETARAFTSDGFLLTGDLGMVDDEGCLHVLGRRKELIQRGGFNIYPREVEDRLLAHPAVLDTAVVGLPDDVLGEMACACIVPVEGAIVTGDEVKEFCRESLAEYKVPDLVRFFPQFPTDGAGRVRRVELARIVSAEERTRRA